MKHLINPLSCEPFEKLMKAVFTFQLKKGTYSFAWSFRSSLATDRISMVEEDEIKLIG